MEKRGLRSDKRAKGGGKVVTRFRGSSRSVGRSGGKATITAKQGAEIIALLERLSGQIASLVTNSM